MLYFYHNKKIEARGPREPDMKPNVRINRVKGYGHDHLKLRVQLEYEYLNILVQVNNNARIFMTGYF